MATSNLQKRSLGSTELSSGQGSPDHVAPIGSLYTDTLTGKTYVNTNSLSDGWELLQTPSFGEIYISTNTTVTTIASANTWISFSGLTGWTLGSSNGFTQTGTSSLLVGSNKGGKYLVTACATLQFSAAAGIYDIGVSVNGSNPISGRFNSTYLPTTTYRECVVVSTYIDLVPGDNIAIVVRCTTATNVILNHAVMTATKVF